MAPGILLACYCIAIAAASLGGGLVPLVVRLTHRRMEFALSFVSGVMLGVALLELLPHALAEREAWLAAADAAAHAAGAEHEHADHGGATLVMLWVLAGFLTMFFLERWFCFHHHEAPHDAAGPAGVPDGGAACAHHDPPHQHAFTWGGAIVGLTLHSLIAGVALAASARSQADDGVALAGLGTFLAIVLHKPFDSLTIGALMAAGGHPTRVRHVVNGLFSLAVPLGAGLFLVGLMGEGAAPGLMCVGLAFAAGTFLCIALSDVLPELQFHQHDRVTLSFALLAGLAVAGGATLLE